MNHNVDKTRYTVFRDISKDDLFVAIENYYVPKIQKIVMAFGRVENVPENNQIPGIYLQNKGGGKFYLNPDENVSLISIANLRSDNN